MQDKKLTLTEHLIELRGRLIFLILALVTAIILSYIFAGEIYNFLLQPLIESYGDKAGRRIIYTSPAEAFLTYVKLSFFSGLFFTFPLFLAQIYFFIAPGLYKKEKKVALGIFFFVPILFLVGAAIAYYFIFPLCFKFFLSFEVANINSAIPIELEAKISEYLSLVIHIIFGFGIAFQLPVALILLVKLRFLSVEGLREKRKYWIVLIFIISAILTPPDAVSQLLMAIPLILLYEISILISKRFN